MDIKRETIKLITAEDFICKSDKVLKNQDFFKKRLEDYVKYEDFTGENSLSEEASCVAVYTKDNFEKCLIDENGLTIGDIIEGFYEIFHGVDYVLVFINVVSVSYIRIEYSIYKDGRYQDISDTLTETLETSDLHSSFDFIGGNKKLETFSIDGFDFISSLVETDVIMSFNEYAKYKYK